MTQADPPSMVYCTEVSVILWQPAHTSVWCMRKPENTDSLAAKYYVTGTSEYKKYLVNQFSFYKPI